MGMISYCFYSNHLLLLRLGSDHSGRHRITHPTAQGQEGDQEDEEQAAHGGMRGERILEFSFIPYRFILR